MPFSGSWLLKWRILSSCRVHKTLVEWNARWVVRGAFGRQQQILIEGYRPWLAPRCFSFGYPSGVYIFGNASTKGKAFFIDFVYVEEGLILSIAKHGNDRRMSHWRIHESDWGLVVKVPSFRNDNFRVTTLVAIGLVVIVLETSDKVCERYIERESTTR